MRVDDLALLALFERRQRPCVDLGEGVHRTCTPPICGGRCLLTPGERTPSRHGLPAFNCSLPREADDVT